MSAFTSCHAETQREREGVGSGLQDKSTATIHRHRSTNCALRCTFCSLYNQRMLCTLQVVFSTKEIIQAPSVQFCSTTMSRVRVGARWAAAGEPLPSALVAPSVRQTAPPCTSAHCVHANTLVCMIAHYWILLAVL